MIETRITNRKDKASAAAPVAKRKARKALASGVFGTLDPPAKKPAAKPTLPTRPNLP